MKFNADAYFEIGTTHSVCQDYARAGHTRGSYQRTFAVLSDGCSSSPDTDIGARLLVLAAERWIGSIIGPDLSAAKRLTLTIEDASRAARFADVTQRALDATLLCAYESWDRDRDGIAASLRGDGVVAGRRRNGSTWIHVVEHTNGAPTYPSYMLDDERRRQYEATFGLALKHSTIGAFGDSPDSVGPLDWFFPACDWDLVLLMSDGVQSFQRVAQTETSRSLEPVPVEAVVRELLAVKGTAGEFMKRRCQAFRRFCDKEGWQHSDDFSVAGIWIAAPEEQAP